MQMPEPARYWNKGNNSGTGIPVMSDAGGIGLDAGAQLCLLV